MYYKYNKQDKNSGLMHVHSEKAILITSEFSTRLNLKSFEYHDGKVWQSMLSSIGNACTQILSAEFIGLGNKDNFFLRRLWKDII